MTSLSCEFVYLFPNRCKSEISNWQADQGTSFKCSNHKSYNSRRTFDLWNSNHLRGYCTLFRWQSWRSYISSLRYVKDRNPICVFQEFADSYFISVPLAIDLGLSESQKWKHKRGRRYSAEKLLWRTHMPTVLSGTDSPAGNVRYEIKIEMPVSRKVLNFWLHYELMFTRRKIDFELAR